MTAESLLASGKLDDGISAIKQQIRQDPTKASLRVGLFQALCLTGEWERARQQISVAADLDGECSMLKQLGVVLTTCEQHRAEVFSGKRAPLLLGEPEEWIAPLIQALTLDAQGEHVAAGKARAKAMDSVEAIPGQINGQDFEWIADGDSRLGPVFEAFISGLYYWVPSGAISMINISEPKNLRDLVWVPALFVLTNGGQHQGFIPVRYPGSESSDQDQIRMGRLTDWTELEYGYKGIGQRMIHTDNSETPILEAREICLEQKVDG